MEECRAPFLVPVHENLCVTARTKNVASLFELTTELEMIENLAVGREYDLAVFVCQWLRSSVTVEGTQPDMRETDSLTGKEAIPIGSPVPDGSSHTAQRLNRHTGGRPSHDTGYPTH